MSVYSSPRFLDIRFGVVSLILVPGRVPKVDLLFGTEGTGACPLSERIPLGFGPAGMPSRTPRFLEMARGS